MSKLAHSHQPSMNRIERNRLYESGEIKKPTNDQLENGEVCAICWRVIEETNRPCACEECGGDAVLIEDAP